MALARLLAAALVICSVPAFAQDQKSGKLPAISQANSSSATAPVSDLSSARTTPSELSRIILNRPADLGPFIPDPSKANRGLRTFRLNDGSVIPAAGLDGQLDAETTCYAIRSYVVARDSKESDSTHPVSYSTCQPSNRYQVRTTELRSTPGER